MIATSPAAVRFALAQAPLRQRAGQAWFAPGGGTAASLRRAGISNVRHPLRGAGAEALLDDPQLQDLDHAPIGLLTAPEGRPLLAQALRARGAQLQVAEVYQREPLAPAAARLRALAALPVRSALLLSSGEALASLWRSLDAAGTGGLARDGPAWPPARAWPRRRASSDCSVLAVAQDARPEHLLAALATQAAAIR